LIEDCVDRDAAAAVERACAAFRARFGREPRWTGYAPGRVNLIGEHTDYNGGYVLPVAVNRYCGAAVGPAAPGAMSCIASDDLGEHIMLDARAPIVAGEGMSEVRRGSSLSYVAGVMAGYQGLAECAEQVNVMVASEVPMGAGLSSSAAVEVATACALELAWGLQIDPLARALACQRAEHEFAGVPCGIMDQIAAVFGRKDRALLIDCRDQSIEEVPLGGGVAILLVDTMVRHSLADGGYGSKRRACERAAAAIGVSMLRDADGEMLERSAGELTEAEYRCARHVITENERTLRASRALREQDYPEVGGLMWASHRSLREDFGVSCEALDVLVAAAAGLPGVHGAKMTGAGFGGSVVVLVEREAAGEVSRGLAGAFEARFGRSCRVLAVNAGPGCGARAV
jgi:galactokinase